MRLHHVLLECFLILSIILSSWRCQCTHILAVLPSVWKSHYLFGYQLLEKIIEQKNYSVTLISPYEGGGFGQNVDQRKAFDYKLREIRVDGLLDNWSEMGLSFDIDEMHEKSVLEHFTRLMYATTSNTDNLLQSSKVRELLLSPHKFDLLVIDLFLSDALLGLAYYYQIPTVVLSPSGSNTWLNQRFGNPQNAALDPSNFLTFTKEMSLWQRCINTMMAMFEKLTYSFFHMISQQAVYTKHFEPLCQLASWCLELPHHKELTENLSLALINTHPVLQYSRAFLPNMLTIAGAHLQTKENSLMQLPNHLKSFIDEASGGVIYMSFGANVYDFPQDKMELILDVFETLPDMRFIVKYDEEDALRMTLNSNQRVMIQDWWPQQAILAHDNVKLFITSAGFMSVTEAIELVKPILAIPITAEQYVLAANLKNQNAAYVLKFNELTYDHLLYALNCTLNSNNYTVALKEMKSLLVNHINGFKPIDIVLDAIDMTLKTKGLNHLKTHSHHLNFWSSILMDVMLILLSGLLAILVIPFLVTSCILRKSHQHQVNLALLNNQIRYQRQVNDFIKNCPKHMRHENLDDDDSHSLGTVRRSSSNSELHLKRKRLPSICSNSSSCVYCSSSVSPSAPGTPQTRDSPCSLRIQSSVEVNDNK